jgi:hypothetical protein
MFFSFLGGREGFSLPKAMVDYFPGEWIQELCMVHDGHLFVLQFHTGTFGIGWKRRHGFALYLM